MLGAVEMLGGVLVFGGITAADVAALHAQPEMYPGVAHFQALFAALGVWRHFVNVAQMRAIAHDLPTPIPKFPAGIVNMRISQPNSDYKNSTFNAQACPKDVLMSTL